MKNPLVGSGSTEGSTNGEAGSEPSVSDVDELVELVRETGDVEDIYENIDVLGAASKADYGRVRGQLKDATGVNLNQMDAAVREAREEHQKEKREKAREARRQEAEQASVPMVQVTDRPSPDVVDDLRAAFQKANNPPKWFRREREIVSVEADEEDRPQIETVSDARFDDRLVRCARCVDKDYDPKDPPQRIVDRVAERVDLPSLRGVTSVPILRPDGTIQSEPGYDEATKQLYYPDTDMAAISVPAEPTPEERDEARRWLEKAWIDHPFTNDASWSNMIALALTPIVRPLLDDANVPIAIIDAPRAGSGKDLAAQIAALGSTGRFPGTMNNPSGPDEWRKQITAQLERGERFIVVSDLTGTLDNPPLRRALTTPVWSDRILGVTRQVRLPADAVWCATGNNLRPRGDMVRRCYLIRIDTEMARPWTRTDFTYKQPQWAREHRVELASALLTLARSWIIADRPEPDTPTLGSFEEWCRVVGGILQHAGFEDFLGNQKELTDTEFSEDNEWSLLLEAIREWQEESLGGEPFTARELTDRIETYQESAFDSEDSLIGPIVDRLPERIQRRVRRDEPFTQSLGKTLGWNKDRRFPGGWYLEKVDSGREGAQWTVRRDEGDSGTNQNLHEGGGDNRSDNGTGESPSDDDVFGEDLSDAPF